MNDIIKKDKLSFPCMALTMVVLVLLVSTTFGDAEIYSFDELKIMSVLNSLICIGLGFLMKNVEPNRWIGIRVKWTKSSEENWKETHRFAARMYKVCGLMALLASLVAPHFLHAPVALTVPSFFSIMFSYAYYRDVEKIKLAL